MRVPSLLAALLLAVACGGSTPTQPAGPLDRQVVLAPGQHATLPGTALSLRFEGVEGDSRCPADAICVWGGDALVRITVSDGRAAAAYELHTGSMQPVRHGDYTISLVQLAPYPFSDRPIPSDEYRATLRVTR